MRLILAVCVALICGESLGSVEAYHWRRTVGSALIPGGGDVRELIIRKENTPIDEWASILTLINPLNEGNPHPGGPFFALARQEAVVAGSSIDVEGMLWSEHPIGAQSSTLSSFALYFRVLDTGVQDSLTLNFFDDGGGHVSFYGPAPTDYVSIGNGGSETFLLTPGEYLIDMSLRNSLNSATRFGLQLDFSSLSFNADGPAIDTEFVPEASSVVAWAALALMGLALPLKGRLQTRFRRLHP